MKTNLLEQVEKKFFPEYFFKNEDRVGTLIVIMNTLAVIPAIVLVRQIIWGMVDNVKEGSLVAAILMILVFGLQYSIRKILIKRGLATKSFLYYFSIVLTIIWFLIGVYAAC